MSCATLPAFLNTCAIITTTITIRTTPQDGKLEPEELELAKQAFMAYDANAQAANVNVNISSAASKVASTQLGQEAVRAMHSAPSGAAAAAPGRQLPPSSRGGAGYGAMPMGSQQQQGGSNAADAAARNRALGNRSSISFA